MYKKPILQIRSQMALLVLTTVILAIGDVHVSYAQDVNDVRANRQYIKDIKSGKISPNESDVSRLLGVVADRKATDSDRIYAFNEAMSISRSTQSKALLLDTVSKSYPIKKVSDHREAKIGYQIVNRYLEVTKEIIPTMDVENKERACRIIAKCASRPTLYERAVQSIVQLPQAEREIGILAISDIEHMGKFPSELNPYVTDEAHSQIRSKAIQDLNAGRIYTSGLIYLMEKGDKAILPALHEALDKETDSRRKTSLGEFVWCVEVQETQEKLLECLREVPNNWDQASRQMFALKRTIERKIPNEKIRAALEDQLKRADLDQNRTARGSLELLKYHAVEAGIMKESDLSGIDMITDRTQPKR